LYPWRALDSIPWVRVLSPANPLTYVSEGFRAAVTPTARLDLLVLFPVLLGSPACCSGGMHHFWRRVVG
jgi:ABC-2 type transport system permease protein